MWRASCDQKGSYMRFSPSSFFKRPYHFLVVLPIILVAVISLLVAPTPSLAASRSTKIPQQSCQLSTGISFPLPWNPPQTLSYTVIANCDSRINIITVTADVLAYDETFHKWVVQNENLRDCSGCYQLESSGSYPVAVGSYYKIEGYMNADGITDSRFSFCFSILSDGPSRCDL
jgi:hypothetical protein